MIKIFQNKKKVVEDRAPLVSRERAKKESWFIGKAESFLDEKTVENLVFILGSIKSSWGVWLGKCRKSTLRSIKCLKPFVLFFVFFFGS